MADASLVFDIDSSQAARAAKDLRTLDSAAAKAAGSVDRFGRAGAGAAMGTASYARSFNDIKVNLAGFGVSMEQAAASLAAQRNAALSAASGVDTLAAGLGRANQQARGYAQGMAGVNNIQGSVGNQFAQLNDIVVTAWGGMNPALIGMQQGMQMVQGFAGQSVPQALGTLKGAFLQLLSPMTLLTVGVIAGGAALVQFGMSLFGASDDVDKFSDRLDDLDATTKRLKSGQDVLKMSANQLFAEYGTGASLVRSAAEALGEFDLAGAQRQFNAVFEESKEALSGFGTNLSAIVPAYEAAAQARSSLTVAEISGNRALLDSLLAYQQAMVAVDDLAGTLGITQEAAKDLSQSFYDLYAATDLSSRVAALNDIREQLANAGIELSKLPEEMYKLLQEASKVNDVLARSEGTIAAATSATNGWQSAMSGVLGVIRGIAGALAAISGKGIEFASAQAEIDALRAGQTLQQAAFAGKQRQIALEGKARAEELSHLGIVGQAQAAAETAAKYGLLSKQQELMLEQDIAREREKESKSSGSKGAAELKAAQKNFQSLRELLEQDSIFQYAEYEKRQLQLDNALSKQLLTITAYEEMKAELKTFYFGTEYEKQQLQYEMDLEALKVAKENQYITEKDYADRVAALHAAQQQGTLQHYSNFFGNMASAAKAGGDKASAVVKAFSIAQGLTNSYLAYTQVLADPSLIGRPFLRTALAASTLASGLAQVANMGGGGGGGGGSKRAATTTTQVAEKPQAEKTTIIRLNGDGYFTDFVGGLMEEIYKQSKDGRVIIAGYNT